MKKYYQLVAGSLLLATVIFVAISCEKDAKTITPEAPAPVSPVPTGSFTEQFDNVSDLSSKGWVFVNNSVPIGEAGWRQGRYEMVNAGNKKLIGAVTVGFPAYSAKNSPHDFISCDITAADPSSTANYSAWLISPAVPMKNGDKISFYTVANALDVDPTQGVSTADRMQVRLNFTGSAAMRTDSAAVGGFNVVAYDSNPNTVYNIAGGHPTTWTKITITLAGIPGGSTAAGRFAFRYYIQNAGLYGGSTGARYPSVVGIDDVAFVHN